MWPRRTPRLYQCSARSAIFSRRKGRSLTPSGRFVLSLRNFLISRIVLFKDFELPSILSAFDMISSRSRDIHQGANVDSEEEVQSWVRNWLWSSQFERIVNLKKTSDRSGSEERCLSVSNPRNLRAADHIRSRKTGEY